MDVRHRDAPLALAASFVGLFAWGLRQIATPTRGPTIDPRASGAALVVIDLQTAFTREAGLPPDATEAALQGVESASAAAVARGVPVLQVRQVTRALPSGGGDNFGCCGSPTSFLKIWGTSR